MNTGKEIVKFSKDILENLSKIDDIVDKVSDPIKDYTDTISDLIAPVKSLIALSNLKRKLSLKAFIKNYANELNSNYEIDKQETEKLEHFFQNKKNIQFIAEIIDNAISAKCVKSSALLGAIAGKILKNKNDLDIEYFSVIDSLKAMNDIDLINFVGLYEYIQLLEKENEEVDEFRTRDFYKNENQNKIPIERVSLELTIEKLKRTGGLSFSEGGIGQVGNARGAFEINAISQELYFIITETKIIE